MVITDSELSVIAALAQIGELVDAQVGAEEVAGRARRLEARHEIALHRVL